jgi:flagellar hook-associated protein 2
MGSGGLECTVSSSAMVAASIGEGAAEGSYSLEVTDIGAYATSLSAAAWVNASGAARTYTLKVGDASYTITPEDNSAAAVASAINAKTGNQVRATVVNVGPAGAPDLRISLQCTTLGDFKPDLSYAGASLQTQQTTGKLAQYSVGGSGKTVSSNTRSVSLTDGLKVTLLSSNPGHPVDITVIRSTSALTNAMQQLAVAYNDAVAALDGQYGESAGALSGETMLYDLRNALRSIGSYSSPDGDFADLAALGLELGRDGKLNLNTYKLMAADVANSAGVTAFLGSAAAGGFLKVATDAMARVYGENGSAITVAKAAIKDQGLSLDARISEKQEQVDALERRLLEQMSAADAAIAAMEQKYSYVSGMFQAMRSASEQY